MSIKSGFFNANVTIENNVPVYDRAGTAEEFAHYFSCFVSNGVFMDSSDRFQVLADTGMNLIVKQGTAWINGYYAWAQVDQNITLSASSTSNPRIDRVILRLNLTRAGREITLEVLEGTPSANPVAPTLTRNTEFWEIALADIEIAANTSSISQASINDRRLDTDLCGIVTSIIDQVDTTTLYAQIQADLADFKTVNEASFRAWVESIHDILDSETAGHLLELIQEIKDHTFVELTVTAGETSINITDGTRFHLDLTQDTEFNFITNDGDVFVLIVDVINDNLTMTFPDNSEIIGDLENTAGLQHVIVFLKHANIFTGYVLGKND